MSLLERLLVVRGASRRLEDFFTEVFAYLLSVHPDLCIAWLEESGILTRTETRRRIRVTTQRRFTSLENDERSSRPDVVIESTDVVEAGSANSEDSPSPDTVRDLVFVESKIGSREGEDQLPRYARLLSAQRDARHRKLVYLTRDYDPKNEEASTRGLWPKVDLVPARWHGFYRILEEYQRDRVPESDLIEEVLLFMKEQGMSQSNRLSASDVAALSGMIGMLSFMRETLSGEVEDGLREASGTKLARRGETLKQLADQERYFVYAVMGREFWCGAGFYLHKESPEDYPWLSVCFEVGPQQEGREEIISAMRAFIADAPHPRAHAYDLDDPATWSGLEWCMDLGELLIQEDHMAAARAFFIEALGDVASLRTQYPDLPWNERV